MADKMELDSLENDLAGTEDEEMMAYKKCGLSTVTFQIVHDVRDMDSPALKSNSFKPEMAHQVFGETEMIFGYKRLSINLYYLHNSAKCYVDLQCSGIIPETKESKADDIMGSLNPWLPENYRTDLDTFKGDIQEEQHDNFFGKIIDTFEGERERNYKITLCDHEDEKFREFHQRFETLLVWFIDGANYIDLEDTRWMIFYVYEEYVDETTKSVIRSPIGLATVYKFFLYPNYIRPRISQFFVLPTHQRKGIATKLYRAVFNHLKNMREVGDVTVEEPTPVFQQIRDLSDSQVVYRDLAENHINISTKHEKQIQKYLKKHKLCKRQRQRVFDILECSITYKNGYKEYVKFTESIKKRIAAKIKKETLGSKRLCNLLREGIPTQPIDTRAAIDAEYNTYINSLEWPVNHLRSYLNRSS